MFSSFQITTLFEHYEISSKVKGHAFDFKAMKILLDLKLKNSKNQKGRQLIVWDLIKQKEQTQAILVDKEIIGRFSSELFILVDGHFYFNNDVIKIRYDQIKKSKFKPVREHTLFDHFSEIIDLRIE